MMKAEQSATPASTLIEFPGSPARPQWRKELSERVREIQERRSRAAVLESGVADRKSASPSSAAAPAAPLGLVPPAETPEVNPIVIAALQRIERARQMPPPVRATSRGTATALKARVVEPEIEEIPERAPAAVVPPESRAVPVAQKELTPQASVRAVAGDEKTSDRKPSAENPQRAHKLVAIPAHPIAAKVEPQRSAKVATATASTPVAAAQPRRVFNEVLDDALLDRIEREASATKAMTEGERAPAISRMVAAVIDLFIVAFAASPFAAVIVLMDGNWMDGRVSGAMLGFAVVVMFLYQVTATALAGRTWGMSLVSLYIVEAERGRAPTTGQAMGRAIIYILSLASFGIGILYALFDSQGRTAHDHLSGTIVVRE